MERHQHLLVNTTQHRSKPCVELREDLKLSHRPKPQESAELRITMSLGITQKQVEAMTLVQCVPDSFKERSWWQRSKLQAKRANTYLDLVISHKHKVLLNLISLPITQ